MNVIELISISKKYAAQEILKNIDLTVKKEECLAIMGESGSGKTTLAKIIIGLENFDSGELKKNIKNIEFLFQNSYNALNPKMNVEELIYEPLIFNKKKIDKTKFIIDLLEQVGLSSEILARKRDELSGGQLQRVCLARALATNPEIIIFDETLSGLDTGIQNKILDLLYKLQKEKKLTYIFISHDLRLCYYIADRIIIMNNGKIQEDFSKINIKNIEKIKKINSRKIF